MTPLKRAALIAALATFGFAPIINRSEPSWPIMLGGVISMTWAIWGVSGICVFVGKRENVVNNWLSTVLIMGTVMVIGTLVKRPEGPYLHEFKLNDGTVKVVEFDRAPNAEALAEVKGYLEGMNSGQK